MVPKKIPEKHRRAITNIAVSDASTITNEAKDVLPPERTSTRLSMWIVEPQAHIETAPN
jgi:hypothetical protein